jgi:surfeit locus 1 family protein
MIRQLPLIPTILVVAAAATMVWLGFWQLGKVSVQEERLQQYEVSAANPELVVFPQTPEQVDKVAYRKSSIDCAEIISEARIVAGRSARDQTGYVQVVTCKLASGGEADVQLGWTRATSPIDWRGGEVTGTIEPLRTGFAKLVADPPLAGLEANAPVKKKQIAHLAYAGQWFFFALVALMIYFFAVRSRLAKRD